jgi:CMP-N-acetylneuraminic acid synthetase
MGREVERIVALIPARGGSKGVPGKNIRELNGKPLIQYSIDAAMNSEFVDEVYVSTDDSKIATVAQLCGASLVDRPRELATDSSTTDEAISHFINTNDFGKNCIIILLQPTSPLRSSIHIDEAFRQYIRNPVGMVLSVTEPQHHPMKSFRVSADGTLQGICDEESPFLPRQILPKVYMPNGAIYIFSSREFEKNNSLPRKTLIPYLMSTKDSCDIDSLADFIEAERILKESNYERV